MKSKNAVYLILFMSLLVLTGCETVKGASNGFGQDMQNLSNPDKNGWNAIENADAWIRENLW
ncbi:MAG: hypothetical protein KGJ09_07855 [Candidatus Omnitrophica bacterium]|nr:hypothetical protein [Candidatus Omnitrophota bacterium]MDE2009976.1 hypothetical protein [Candidatus Omnitrophota bacterium]MDE2213954.1 hypothetical protein [Candidatus Omnitrophota bacterium]MDE2231896.1 hypothetical protein [Candidatus Omnitrophota bacterium]